MLMYHAIGSPMPGDLAELSVPPALLADQLAALVDAGHRLVGLGEALALREREPDAPVVALTFDDGYTDFVEHGLDVLAARGAGATLYVPSRHLGGTASWLPGAAGGLPILDAGALAEVAAAGVEVGSHGAVHVPLDVRAPALVDAELRESRAVLEDVVGAPVTGFCYPHGYHSAAVRARVRAAGYRHACAIGHRPSRPGEDPFAVSRWLVGPHHAPADVLALAARRRGAARSALVRVGTPGWRVARRLAARTGRTWT